MQKLIIQNVHVRWLQFLAFSIMRLQYGHIYERKIFKEIKSLLKCVCLLPLCCRVSRDALCKIAHEVHLNFVSKYLLIPLLPSLMYFLTTTHLLDSKIQSSTRDIEFDINQMLNSWSKMNISDLGNISIPSFCYLLYFSNKCCTCVEIDPDDLVPR